MINIKGSWHLIKVIKLDLYNIGSLAEIITEVTSLNIKELGHPPAS